MQDINLSQRRRWSKCGSEVVFEGSIERFYLQSVKMPEHKFSLIEKQASKILDLKEFDRSDSDSCFSDGVNVPKAIDEIYWILRDT